MKYTARISSNLMTKNSLQRSIQEYIQGIDRILIINNKDLSEFKTNVIANIVFLNNENPRCTPVKARWIELDKNDWLLAGVDFCHFIIRHVKKDYLPNNQ
ncbi:hypothetical protein [Pseudotamlana carrageenivorans]|uniref:hypothetical protein n=1 Tax=Pseudotamlana carrageenivorans TaxID=2069432 RepID=UPI0013153D98|nr:hypothetical protein [Tamlana carrageenivorans]